MKRIGNSKEPNARQMLNMALNFREKFNKPAMIEVDAWAFTVNKKVVYYLYIESMHTSNHETWAGAIAKYRELMKKELEQ